MRKKHKKFRYPKKFPKVITVTRSFTYDLESLASDLNDLGDEDITLENMLGYIAEWATEDFSTHPDHSFLEARDERNNPYSLDRHV